MPPAGAPSKLFRSKVAWVTAAPSGAARPNGWGRISDPAATGRECTGFGERACAGYSVVRSEMALKAAVKPERDTLSTTL